MSLSAPPAANVVLSNCFSNVHLFSDKKVRTFPSSQSTSRSGSTTDDKIKKINSSLKFLSIGPGTTPYILGDVEGMVTLLSMNDSCESPHPLSEKP